MIRKVRFFACLRASMGCPQTSEKLVSVHWYTVEVFMRVWIVTVTSAMLVCACGGTPPPAPTPPPPAPPAVQAVTPAPNPCDNRVIDPAMNPCAGAESQTPSDPKSPKE